VRYLCLTKFKASFFANESDASAPRKIHGKLLIICSIAAFLGAGYSALSPVAYLFPETENCGDRACRREKFLDPFDGAEFSLNGSVAAYSATLSLDADLFGEIDTVGFSDASESYTAEFLITYDYNGEILTLQAAIDAPDGLGVVDSISGSAFFSDNGKIDAVFIIDGQPVYLSELADL
jgi:hypothetical protein